MGTTLVVPADHATVFTNWADAAFAPLVEEAGADFEEGLDAGSEGVCRPSMQCRFPGGALPFALLSC